MKGFATARLEAQPVVRTDLPFLVALWSDERVARTLGGPRGEQQVVAYALISNAPSLAVLGRLEFVPEAPMDLPAGPHWLYRKVLTGGTGQFCQAEDLAG
jgi:hypothetical protein